MPGPRGSSRGGVREWDSDGADGRGQSQGQGRGGASWRGGRGGGRGGGGRGGPGPGLGSSMYSESSDDQQSWRGRGGGGASGAGRGSGRWVRGGGGGGGGRGGGRGRAEATGTRNWRDEAENGAKTANAIADAGASTPSDPSPPTPTSTTSTTTATATPSASRDGRLKPPRDPSGGHGLVSKGDTQLLDPIAQETLFTSILDKYTPFLLQQQGPAQPPTHTTTPRTQHIDQHTATTQTLLLALRSLREALLATARLDTFTTTVYTFNARTSILLKHKESYLPSLLHLLRAIHPNTPLPPEHLAEFAGYYVLHLGVVMGEFNEAYIARREYRTEAGEAGVKWGDVDTILRAAVRNDYWTWSRMKGRVGVEVRKLMEMGEERVVRRAVGCLGKAYFEVGREWVEGIVGMEVGEVRKRYSEDWEVVVGEEAKGEKVVVRRRGKGNAGK